jgi:hypothetical protein
MTVFLIFLQLIVVGAIVYKINVHAFALETVYGVLNL